MCGQRSAQRQLSVPEPEKTPRNGNSPRQGREGSAQREVSGNPGKSRSATGVTQEAPGHTEALESGGQA